jgi:hypothetical protein
MLLSTNFSKYPQKVWDEYSNCEDWYLEPSGEQVVETTNSALILDSAKTKDLSTTYASLVTSIGSFYNWSKLNVTYQTLDRHRGNPFNWEVAWVLWNFEDVNRFYSAILKPTGWEIAKEWKDVDGFQRQHFLAFSSSKTFPVDHKYELQITQKIIDRDTLSFTLSAKDLTTGGRMTKVGSVVDDGTGESGAVYYGGKVGLYVEDCRAAYYTVKVK